MRLKRELLIGFGMRIGSVILFLMLAEVVCRILPIRENPTPLDPNNFKTDRAGEPDDLLGYRLRPGFQVAGFRYNKEGFVGPEIDKAKHSDTYRIICLGGSTTLGTGADSDTFSYPALLQTIFEKTSRNGTKRIQVLNAGVFGYHSWHTLLRVLYRMDVFRPDMYVLMDGLNDLAAAKSMTLTQLERQDKDDNSLLKVLATKPGLVTQLNSLLSRLKFYRLLQEALTTPTSPNQLGYGLEHLEEKFKLFGYEKNTEQAIRFAQARNISVLLVDYPWKIHDNMFSAQSAMIGIQPENSSFYLQGRTILPEANRKLCEGLKVPMVAPQPLFDRLGATRLDVRRIWADDIHFTRYGNYLLAKSVYREMMSLPGFKEMTGRQTPVDDKELDALFQNILKWRPADGVGWPSKEARPFDASVMTMENIKDGVPDGGSGFSAWTPADPSIPGKIVFQMHPRGASDELTFYARVFSGSRVSLLRPGLPAIKFENDSGDGIWSPMAGWYLLGPGKEERIELVLEGENAQVWHRGKDVFFPGN